jgi:acetyl/propionyl-CoA carboxylase alpha subunit
MVTGVDLVHAQLRIADGLPLDDLAVQPRGHVIECRINAEDPFNGFLPAGGRIEHLRVPGGPGVRWDSGIIHGTEIALHYDPLIAKLIVHASDRGGAIARMARALDELLIDGVATIAPFHRRVMDDAEFRAGQFHTGYLDEHPELLGGTGEAGSLQAVAVIAAMLEDRQRKQVRVEDALGSGAGESAWRRPGGGWSARGNWHG